MTHTSYNPETYHTTTETGQAGQAVVRSGSARYCSGVQAAPCSAETAGADADTTLLQRVAAGILGGVCPREFRAGIDAGNRQMGNRAFLHWVGRLHERDPDPHTNELAAGGFGRSRQALTLLTRMHEGRGNAAATPAPADGPLQLMPKRKKKAAPSADVETLPVFDAAVSEAAVTMPHADPGATATPGQKKKKKKSRVQVALNTLREEGVEAFKKYIEAEIGGAELLHTLVERINRAEDLGGIKDTALRVVEGRLRVLGPETAPTMAAAGGPRPGQVVERPVSAQVKTVLRKREQEFFNAVGRGDVGRIRHLLKHGSIDVNMLIDAGPPLGLATYKGHTAIVRELLSVPGIDVNLAATVGVTPLYLAVRHERVEVVKLLLAARGINVNLVTARGETPLFLAALNGRAEMVELLLAIPGINVNSETSNENVTPLFAAAIKGHKDIASLLLDAPNVDIDACSYTGATPLFVAAEYNFPEIVEQLVKRGADVNLALHTGKTPLCSAAYVGQVEVVRALLQAPAIDLYRTIEGGIVPLATAAMQGHKTIVKLLLRKGADPKFAYTAGIIPLHFACLYGHTAIAEILLHAGADMDAETTTEIIYTPFSLAQLAGHREVMSVLAAFRRRRGEGPVRLEGLTPCLRPQGQALTEEAGETLSIPAVLPDSPGKGSLAPAETLPAATATVPSMPVRSGEGVSEAALSSPLTQAQNDLRQEVLGKLRDDNLESLEGIRLLEDVNASSNIDSLCTLYNRLAGIERQKERARRRGRRREVMPEAAVPAAAVAPVFSLGERTGLDAEAVDAAVKRRLAQRYHRFVGQAVNDMEFGRGKPTSGYRGLWHASAGVAGVGSCSVFYYLDGSGERIRIVGIGHHVGRAAYRLDYATEELGRSGRVLRIA